MSDTPEAPRPKASRELDRKVAEALGWTGFIHLGKAGGMSDIIGVPPNGGNPVVVPWYSGAMFIAENAKQDFWKRYGDVELHVENAGPYELCVAIVEAAEQLTSKED